MYLGKYATTASSNGCTPMLRRDAPHSTTTPCRAAPLPSDSPSSALPSVMRRRAAVRASAVISSVFSST